MKAAPDVLVLIVGLVTGAVTLAGGGAALKLRGMLSLLLGLSSGAITGVALFDLIPQALNLAGEANTHLPVMTAVASGFCFYMLVDRVAAWAAAGRNGLRGHLAPASLTAHSLMDGLGIGLAFHVSYAVGLVVALAVMAHDLLDGANTVTLSLAGGTGERAARRWLAADAMAPLVGIGLARLLPMSTFTLAVCLAVFAGFFLYIGASELLPRSRDRRPQWSTMGATLAGFAFIYGVIRAAGG
jgi:zinc transporter ZupT